MLLAQTHLFMCLPGRHPPPEAGPLHPLPQGRQERWAQRAWDWARQGRGPPQIQPIKAGGLWVSAWGGGPAAPREVPEPCTLISETPHQLCTPLAPFLGV